MRRFLFIVLTCICINQVSAQRFSAGLIGGASCWMFLGAVTKDTWKENSLFPFDKGVFVRYDSKDWFALEFSTVFFNMNDIPELYTQRGVINGGRIKFHEYSLNCQSLLSKKSRKVEHYLGWSFTYGVQNTEVLRYKGLGQPESATLRESFGGLGFTHSLRYPILPHCYISLKNSLTITAGESVLFDDTAPLRLQSMLGLSYSI